VKPGLWLGWVAGMGALDLGPEVPSPRSCGACHDAEHEQWAASGHARSWSNDLMLAGYAMEPLDFCQSCHAPLPAQQAEIRANHDWYVSLDPSSGIPAGSVIRQPEPHADDGVTCAVCHWRDGEILAAQPSGFAPHRVRAAPELATGAFCETCHDFAVAESRDGVTRFTTAAMQATGAEWRAWGGDQTCQDCHMPDSEHRFVGVHDREALQAAVAVEQQGRELVLRSVGVGHHLPSGDVFRHLTVEVWASDGWQVVDWIGRRFVARPGPDGRLHQQLAVDTALRPGEPRRVVLPAGGQRWRVVWHDASAREERAGLLDPAQITFVLAASPPESAPR